MTLVEKILHKILEKLTSISDSTFTGQISDFNVVFVEKFTGNGIANTFQLTGNIDNGNFVQGTWDSLNIKNTLKSHIARYDNGQPVYDAGIISVLTRTRVNVTSINLSGLVTLNVPPQSGVEFFIAYWYDLQDNDKIDNYVREDFVSEMEADLSDINEKINLKLNSNDPDYLANTAARHTHSNKALLDTYTQTEVNLADAVTKKHTSGTETQGGDISGNVSNAEVQKIRTKQVNITGRINDTVLVYKTATDNYVHESKTLQSEDIHSGINIIDIDVTIKDKKEMIVSHLTVNETLTVDGTLTILN